MLQFWAVLGQCCRPRQGAADAHAAEEEGGQQQDPRKGGACLTDRVLGFDKHHDLLTGIYHAGHAKVILSLNETAQKILWRNALIEGETAYAALELTVAGFTEAFDDWLD